MTEMLWHHTFKERYSFELVSLGSVIQFSFPVGCSKDIDDLTNTFCSP